MNHIPSNMQAVTTRTTGGYDVLFYGSVPTPEPDDGEILIRVCAAGVNNTDINTRIGWYSDDVTGATEAASDRQEEQTQLIDKGGWKGATPFPLIQGTDCCGIAVKSGPGVDDTLIGKRVLVRPCMLGPDEDPKDMTWLASDRDGAFAQYVCVPASEVFAVHCDWQDTDLAAIPCAYGTAENLLHRSSVAEKDTLLITGASGGVGMAAVQLAKLRGATVYAVSSGNKKSSIRELGADRVFDREDDLIATLGKDTLDCVIDCVAGDGFGTMISLLKQGGRYASSGAIGGPLVTLDMRKLYLKDLTLFGCTRWAPEVFPRLIKYIEENRFKPVISKVFPLREIEAAQRLFMEKTHIGKFVLLPPKS